MATLGDVLQFKHGGKMPEKKRWLGKRDRCDLCKLDLSKRGFIDGRTTTGQWALMCSYCHTLYGVGLGTGKGQMYDADGVKISG